MIKSELGFSELDKFLVASLTIGLAVVSFSHSENEWESFLVKSKGLFFSKSDFVISFFICFSTDFSLLWNKSGFNMASAFFNSVFNCWSISLLTCLDISSDVTSNLR